MAKQISALSLLLEARPSIRCMLSIFTGSILESDSDSLLLKACGLLSCAVWQRTAAVMPSNTINKKGIFLSSRFQHSPQTGTSTVFLGTAFFRNGCLFQ